MSDPVARQQEAIEATAKELAELMQAEPTPEAASRLAQLQALQTMQAAELERLQRARLLAEANELDDTLAGLNEQYTAAREELNEERKAVAVLVADIFGPEAEAWALPHYDEARAVRATANRMATIRQAIASTEAKRKKILP